MSLSIGIFGLPNVGKSTLFRALTKKPVNISNYPFTTIEPNVGVSEVDDPRLYQLALIQKPEKVVPAIVKFVDVAGLVRGAHKGEGLGNQFLAHLRECDALLHIVRLFKRGDVTHVNGRINPIEDIEIVETEIILKDLETIEKRLQKITKEASAGIKNAVVEQGILNSLKNRLGQGAINADSTHTKEEKEIVKNLFLLSLKPQIILLNGEKKEIDQKTIACLEKRKRGWLYLDFQTELDKTELGEKERDELGIGEPELPRLIKQCYGLLGLITFFTIVGEKETRAWPLRQGKTVLEAAFMIHHDFGEKFICAEAANWQDAVSAGGWKECRRKGILKTAGRDYIIKDGDVIEIKI